MPSCRRAALVALSAAVVLLSAPVSRAQTPLKPEVSAEIGVFSRYLWRGAVLSDGPVMQPAFTLGLRGLEVGVWGNMDLDDVNGHSGRFGEVDYTASYTLGLGAAELSGGVLNYSYPTHALPSTTELFATLSASVLAAPSLTMYRDVDAGHCSYLSLSVSHAVPLGASSVDASLAAGWGDQAHNSFNYGVAVAGPTDAAATLSIDLPLVSFVSVRPTLGYARMLNGELRTAAAKPDNVFVGLVLHEGL